MQIPDVDPTITVILSVLAAAITGGLGLRRAQAMWIKDGTNIANSGAQSAGAEAQKAIIELMREEMTRMNDSNREMRLQLNEFQARNTQLSNEVAALTQQLSSFKLQNAELQSEIASLREMIREWNEKPGSPWQ